MHNLVKEFAGIDFNELANDLEVAKQVTLSTLGNNLDNLDNKDKASIEACQSVGHLVNEVDWLNLLSSLLIHASFFCAFYLIKFVVFAIDQFSFEVAIYIFASLSDYTFCISYIFNLTSTH